LGVSHGLGVGAVRVKRVKIVLAIVHLPVIEVLVTSLLGRSNFAGGFAGVKIKVFALFHIVFLGVIIQAVNKFPYLCRLLGCESEA